MSVQTLITEYYATSDNDIKYMTLRKNFELVDTGADLRLIMSKLIVPILLDEPSLEIVNLISTELFPQLIKMAIGSIVIDSVLLEPLIDILPNSELRQTSIAQTIRNGLKSMKDNNAFVLDNSRNINLLQRFIENCKSHNFFEIQPQLYKENIELLLVYYFDGNTTFVPITLMRHIFEICYEETLSSTTIDVLKAACRLTNSTNLFAVKNMISDNQLVVITEVWYRFAEFIDFGLTSDLLEDIQNNINSESINLKRIIILKNLHNFFHIVRYSSGTTFLLPRLFEKLIKSLSNILTVYEAKQIELQNKITSLDFKMSDTIETDNMVNDEQDTYISELANDEEEEVELQFEDDTRSYEIQTELENLRKESELVKSISDCVCWLLENIPINEQNVPIIESLQKWVRLDHINLSSVSKESTKTLDINTIMVNGVFDGKYELADIVACISTALSNSEELVELQKYLDMTEHLILNKELSLTENDIRKLSNALIPHLQKNKNYVHTIKVGNMKQKIDDGITLRSSVYSMLLQIEDLPYDIACNLLQRVVISIPKEKEDQILTLMNHIFKKVLQEHYYNIIGLDESWFQQAIISPLDEQLRNESLSDLKHVFITQLIYLIANYQSQP